MTWRGLDLTLAPDATTAPALSPYAQLAASRIRAEVAEETLRGLRDDAREVRRNWNTTEGLRLAELLVERLAGGELV